MESTISKDTFSAKTELDRGPSGGHHHRDGPETQHFSVDPGTPTGRDHEYGPTNRRLSRMEAPTGDSEQLGGGWTQRRFTDPQQRAFPAEAEPQNAPGTRYTFPRAFSAVEADRWAGLEERGALLRAQRMDAIVQGDLETDRGLQEELRRLLQSKQILQERIEELWHEEAWFASRAARQRGEFSLSAHELDPQSRPPLGKNEMPTDAMPQSQPRKQGGVRFPPELEDPPLRTQSREGVRSLHHDIPAEETSELLEEIESLGAQQASLNARAVGPHMRSAQDPPNSALGADGQMCTVSSGRVRSSADSFTTSDGVRSHSGRGKVPRDLPHFRGVRKDSIQDATEFIERFETLCEPHSLDDEQLLKVLPICLDSIDGAWFKLWKEQMTEPCLLGGCTDAFLAHFKHPNELTVLLAQVRALRMDSTGVQRYADQFRRLMAQLGWTQPDT